MIDSDTFDTKGWQGVGPWTTTLENCHFTLILNNQIDADDWHSFTTDEIGIQYIFLHEVRGHDGARVAH